MAEIDKPVWLYPKVALSDEEIADVNRYDYALGGPDRSRGFQIPASTFTLVFQPSAQPNNSTERSAVFQAPFDFEIGEISLSCASGAGASGTADVKAGDTVAGASSILDAAEDILTGAPEPAVVRPEADSEVVEAGQVLFVEWISGDANALVGCGAVVTCKRR